MFENKRPPPKIQVPFYLFCFRSFLIIFFYKNVFLTLYKIPILKKNNNIKVETRGPGFGSLIPFNLNIYKTFTLVRFPFLRHDSARESSAAPLYKSSLLFIKNRKRKSKRTTTIENCNFYYIHPLL
jgi:hypothetical protein